MTLTPDGGAAIPVSVTTTRKVQGGSAIPVYGYTTAPTDGRPAMGGPALPVRVLTAADLKVNGGQWTLEGRPHAMPVYTAPAGATVMGGPALAVYPVNAWPTVPVVPPVTPWYLSGGIAAANCIAAYQAKGAASYAASKVNLANPGTYDCIDGAAYPTWSAAGWACGYGFFQWLDTGITPVAGMSLAVQFADASSPTACLAGSYSGDEISRLALYSNVGTNEVSYQNGNLVTVAPNLTSGNLIVAGNQGYRDGVADGGAIGAFTGVASVTLGIGRLNGFTNYLTGTIIAVAVYDSILTAPQVTALRAAMAAL